MSTFKFTFKNIEDQYEQVKNLGYKFITCEDYYRTKKEINSKDRIVVNRVDIDLSIKKAGRLLDIFNGLDIKATFFLRLHAPEYNPFSFENYRIIKKMVESGHEIGYHSEVIDQAAIWNENAQECLERDIDVINKMFNIKIVGVASHGGMTGLNNLDFWKERTAKEFGLLYEAYDHQPEFNLFQEAFYVSDSEWVRWKCYDKGKIKSGDNRTFLEHANDGHQLINILIHPDTYFDEHFYDNEK